MPKKPAVPAPPLVLEGDLDVFSIHPQWERLLPLLDGPGGRAELNLAGVGDLDLSGIQLLAALGRDLGSQGIELALTGVKTEWASRFAPLGLGALFHEEGP